MAMVWNGAKPTRNGKLITNHAFTSNTDKVDPVTIYFKDAPHFKPNLTPKEVLHQGGFGGGYFRDIQSSVTKKWHKDTWKELPEDWLKGLSPSKQLARIHYKKIENKFGADCGAKQDKSDEFGQAYWESKDWIKAQDPYGWFQWYCRFYQGRRSPDDSRQIQRWLNLAGPKGRFRNNLIKKVYNARKHHNDRSVSPVVRQTLHHWAYTLTLVDYERFVGSNSSRLSSNTEEKNVEEVKPEKSENARKKAKQEREERLLKRRQDQPPPLEARKKVKSENLDGK